MRLGLALGTALLASGCASFLPLAHALARAGDDDDDDDDDDAPSTFSFCEVGYYLAGLAIDGIIVTGDLTFGKETNMYDGLVIVPLVLDALVATSFVVDCVREN
jgi:hypothetical protein